MKPVVTVLNYWKTLQSSLLKRQLTATKADKINRMKYVVAIVTSVLQRTSAINRRASHLQSLTSTYDVTDPQLLIFIKFASEKNSMVTKSCK